MEASNQAAEERLSGWRLLLRVLRRGGAGWTAVLAVASVVLAVAETLLPAALGRALDAVLGTAEPGLWITVAAALVGVVLIADTLDELASGMSGARATAWIRHTVVRHVLALGVGGSRRFSGGDLGARLVSMAADAGRVPTLAVWTITAIVPAVGGAVALALIDPWLCAVLLVALPVLGWLARAFMRDASVFADGYLRVQGLIAGRLGDAVGGARTIAAAGTADREVTRVLAPLPELHGHARGLWRLQGRISAQESVLVPMLELVVLAVAGWLLLRGEITPGGMLAAVQYAGLAAGLGSAASSLGGLAQTRAAAGQLAQVLAQVPPGHGDQSLPPGRGLLELRGVTVHRSGRRVLDDVEIIVPAGACVALVGRSGSGKSVIAAVAARLVDPDEGHVLLDGVPLARLGRSQLRRAVGYAAAGPVLVGETMADVIALGAPACTLEQVRAAARVACADGFVGRLPLGYLTPSSDAHLSGGEAQRVGLARAFLQADRVLVLDDVAASLDTATEHQIGQVLDSTLGDRTRLVVAHRTSTAARSDHVVWLEHGRVLRCGTHEQLWADPVYRAVFAAQVGTEAADAMPGGAVTAGDPLT